MGCYVYLILCISLISVDPLHILDKILCTSLEITIKTNFNNILKNVSYENCSLQMIWQSPKQIILTDNSIYQKCVDLFCCCGLDSAAASMTKKDASAASETHPAAVSVSVSATAPTLSKLLGSASTDTSPNRTERRVCCLWNSLSNYEVKKNQRHTTNKKPNMYKDINKDNQYFGLSNRPSSG